jgi:hypothetical protein
VLLFGAKGIKTREAFGARETRVNNRLRIWSKKCVFGDKAEQAAKNPEFKIWIQKC